MTLCREIDTTLGWFPVSGLLRFAPWTHSVRAPGREASGEAVACGPWMDGCGTGPSGGRAPAGRGWTGAGQDRAGGGRLRAGDGRKAFRPYGSVAAVGAAVREHWGDRGCRLPRSLSPMPPRSLSLTPPLPHARHAPTRWRRWRRRRRTAARRRGRFARRRGGPVRRAANRSIARAPSSARPRRRGYA